MDIQKNLRDILKNLLLFSFFWCLLFFLTIFFIGIIFQIPNPEFNFYSYVKDTGYFISIFLMSATIVLSSLIIKFLNIKVFFSVLFFAILIAFCHLFFQYYNGFAGFLITAFLVFNSIVCSILTVDTFNTVTINSFQKTIRYIVFWAYPWMAHIFAIVFFAII